MTRWITAVPAYGRDYGSAEDVVKDWDAGEDFRILADSDGLTGRYFSHRDIDGTDIAVEISYCGRRKMVIINWKEASK
jgi:hypothetical protein